MPAHLLTGKEPAERILYDVRRDVEQKNMTLVIVQVGSDPASDSYIRKKLDAAASVGIRAEHHRFRDNVTQAELFAEIKALNENPIVTGYIIQLPLPEHIQTMQPQLFREIDPYKDVDGFTAYNLGKIFLSNEFEHLPPATPAGVIALLEYYGIDIQGKHAVVVGHSNIVGKPLAAMLLNRNATVTVCHEYTKNLADYTKQADILCTAVGKPGLIDASMIKPGAVVIDIGTTFTPDGLQGDVDVETVKDVASAITPVPGGVGPMTVACLLRNVVRAFKRQLDRN